jgi:LytS/YehU family sensor histidine kinase
MRVLLLLTKTYKEKGNYERAIQNAQQLLKIANGTGARQFIKDSHFLLYELFDRVKDNNRAYFHLKKYTSIKDSIEADLAAQKLSFYKIKTEREKAQTSIKLLNDEKKLEQQQLQKEALIKKILAASLIVLVVMGIIFFRNIALKRKNERLESERTKAELQQRAAELEMQALRAQMNPHFIFNCLNAINGFILTNDSETAADYLTKFSRLIRMVLNNSQKKLISLEQELETLDLYLYMEHLRFTNNFHYQINCDDSIDALSIFIPPMLFQPFAENAIWHGLLHKEGNGELLINLHLEKDIIHCTITDDGVGRKKAAMLKSKSVEKNKSMGLQITKNRIALLNQDLNSETFFEIQDLEDEYGNATGTKVNLKIKIESSIAQEV